MTELCWCHVHYHSNFMRLVERKKKHNSSKRIKIAYEIFMNWSLVVRDPFILAKRTRERVAENLINSKHFHCSLLSCARAREVHTGSEVLALDCKHDVATADRTRQCMHILFFFQGFRFFYIVWIEQAAKTAVVLRTIGTLHTAAEREREKEECYTIELWSRVWWLERILVHQTEWWQPSIRDFIPSSS